MSNIDWENNNEYVSDGAQEVLDEQDQEYQEVDTYNEAIKRIEQAKLYESLIKHDFFAEGSARAEIQDKVTQEIRDFILNRLEILVGLKHPEQSVVKVELPFNDDEVSALKALAHKLIQKTSNPQVLNNPQVNRFNETRSEPVVVPAKSTGPIVNKVPKQQNTKPVDKPPQKRPPGRPKSNPGPQEPRPEGGLYPKQAVSKTRPPVAMPAQAAIDMLYATQVAKRSSVNSKGSVADQILSLAITSAQQTNAHINEELNTID